MTQKDTVVRAGLGSEGANTIKGGRGRKLFGSALRRLCKFGIDQTPRQWVERDSEPGKPDLPAAPI